MAKITNLDQLIAANVDGSETLPVVKGAKSWRVRLSDLFSPLTAMINALAPSAAQGAQAAASLTAWVDSGMATVNGYYINNSGAAVAVTGYTYLDYTIAASDIAFRATGTVSGNAGVVALAAYINSSGSIISRELVGDGSGNQPYSNRDLTIPAGTAKIRLCGITSATLALTVRRVVSGIADQVAANQSAIAAQASAAATAALKLASISNALISWQRPAYTVEAGYYYDRLTGVRKAGGTWSNIVVPLTGTESAVRVTATVTGGGTALACYFDAGGVFISSELAGPSTGDQPYTNQLLTLPANARSVAITGRTIYALSLDVLQVRAVSADLDTLGATVGNLSASVATASSQTALAYGLLTYWRRPSYTVEAGYYYERQTGTRKAGSSWSNIVVALTGTEAGVRATASVAGDATALAVYFDASGALISSQFAGPSTGNTPYANQLLTVPANARSVVVTGLSSQALSVDILMTRDLAATDTKAQAGQSALASLTTWWASGSVVVDGYYINSAGAAVALSGYRYLDYALDGSETGFRATGTTQGNAAALANYLDANGTIISRQFVGTGSNLLYTDQDLTVPTGTAKIRLCGISSKDLSLSVKKVFPNAAQAILALQAGAGTTLPITTVGDSMAAMLAPVVAGLYPTRTTYAQGLGGQVTAQGAARLGAKQVTLNVSGGQLPASGAVTVTPSIDLLYLYSRPNAVSCRVMVMGVLCNLVCAASTGAYTLQPVTPLGTALTLPNGAATPMQVVSGMVQTTDPSTAPALDTMLKGVVICRLSRNDTAAMTTQAGRDSVMADLAAIVAQVGSYGGKLIMLTGTNGNYDLPTGMATGAAVADAATSAARLSGIAALNAAMLAAWPDKVVDPLGNHILLGGATSRTVNGQTFMVLDQPTLNTDGMHESTATGQPRTGALVKAYINGRSW